MKPLPIAAGAVCLVSASAFAHSWYPIECCSNKDCFQADAVRTDGHGNYDIIIGVRHVRVPHGFNVRPSPDGKAHICFLEAGPDLIPLCLFLPAQV